MFINWWLTKYHNTTLAEVFKEHPDWTKDNPEYNSRMFYEAYQVTEEQHDEWYKWAIDVVAKHYGWTNKMAKREFVWIYLNTSPMIKKI